MANLRSKKGNYYCEFYDPDRHPKRKWVTLRTKDKRAARQKLARLERRYAMGEYDPWHSAAPNEGLLLAEAAEQYVKSRKNKAKKTRRADRSTLGLLEEEVGAGFMLRHVERRHVEAVIERDGLSDATRRTYYARLNAFFGWAVEQGMTKRNPMKKMQPAKVGKTKAGFLTRQQYECLLRCIEADAVLKADMLSGRQVIWLADVVRFAVGTGMRLSEICNLRWRAVNLTTGFVDVKNVHGFKTKSGNERSVPVSGEARGVLERLHAARTSEADGYVFEPTRAPGQKGKAKLNAEYVSKRFLHYVRMEGTLPESIHFHSLRHTYASWLAMAGVDLFRVKELLGHADISTTMRYAHLAPANLKGAVERVFGAQAAAV